MHRFGVGVDPMEDTERKLAAIEPSRARARACWTCAPGSRTRRAARREGARR